MKNEAAFSTWIRTLAHKYTNGLLLFQRIETTTSSGVPDVLMITKNKTLLVELKYETTKLRPMQYAWQKRMQKVSQVNKTLDVCVLCAYPKTKRLVYFVADQCSEEYELSKNGIFKLFDDISI